MAPSVEGGREEDPSASVDELQDEINQFSEYRWMAATLVCCAVGLASAAVLITTGDRFDLRPTPESRLEEKFVEAPDGRGSVATVQHPPDGTTGAKSDSLAPSSQAKPPAPNAPPKRRRIVMRLKSPWCTGGLSSQSFYRCRTRSW